MTNATYAPKSQRIVAALSAKQDAEGLTNTEFAAKLGISTGMWTLIRTGKREMGVKPLAGIAAHYPDIWAMLPSHFSFGRPERVMELAPEKGHSVEPETAPDV